MGRSHSTCPARGVRRSALVAALAAAAALGSARAQEPAPADDLNVWHPSSIAKALSGGSFSSFSHSRTALPNALHLLNDYYFFDPAHSDLSPAVTRVIGGLRASTGVAGPTQPLSLFDNRPDANPSLPYMGLGYSHLWLKNTLSLNADFGLTTQSPWIGSRLRSTPVGLQSLDDVSRELRWAPVMAVNLSYSF